MQNFKFKFSKKIYIVIAIGFIIATACLVINTIRLVALIQAGRLDPYNVISIIIALIMCLAFYVIMIALLLDSSYNFEATKLVAKFGLIKTSSEYKNMHSVVWNKETNKLSIVFNDKSYSVVIIEDGEYQAFAKALQQKNSKIVYLEQTENE